MAEFLHVEMDGDAAVIRFMRPEIRNPLSREVVKELHEIVDRIASKPCGSVIFTGSGEAFASGADLNEIAALTTEEAPEFARLGQSLMQKIDELPQHVVAAINGHCFGGALDLALACDTRIASPNASFCHPGAGLGIITGWSGTQRLPRLIGRANASEMLFTAAPIDARRALQIGLIDQIAEDVMSTALKAGR